MPSKEAAGKSGDLWLGIFFLGTAAFVILFSGSIQSIGLGDNFDPGPKAFPLGLSALLIVGGLVELFTRTRKEKAETNREGKTKTVLILLAAFVLYVILLPWLGFGISTAIMATGMMKLLGNSWKGAAIVSATLIVLIYILFVVLLKVPLPNGVLGMPF